MTKNLWYYAGGHGGYFVRAMCKGAAELVHLGKTGRLF